MCNKGLNDESAMTFLWSDHISGIKKCLSWSSTILHSLLSGILCLVSSFWWLSNLVLKWYLSFLGTFHTSRSTKRHFAAWDQRIKLMRSGPSKSIVHLCNHSSSISRRTHTTFTWILRRNNLQVVFWFILSRVRNWFVHFNVKFVSLHWIVA